jgi:nucleoid-associated protein YgaU
MFARAILKAVLLAVLALLVWSALARPSGAHGPRVVYRVRPDDTLWAIAASRYGGDPRGAIAQIEAVNHLSGGMIYPGESLVLP